MGLPTKDETSEKTVWNLYYCSLIHDSLNYKLLPFFFKSLFRLFKDHIQGSKHGIVILIEF